MNLVVIHLSTGNVRDFLRSLDDLRTFGLPHESAVLEETFVSGKPVGAIGVSHQSVSPDAASPEFPLESHVVIAPEDAVPVKPALHEFAFVPGTVRKDDDPESIEEAILEASVVARPVGQDKVPHAMLLTFVIPVPDVLGSVVIFVAAVLDDSRMKTATHLV